jgi:hypothetical protein
MCHTIKHSKSPTHYIIYGWCLVSDLSDPVTGSLVALSGDLVFGLLVVLPWCTVTRLCIAVSVCY